MKKSLLTLSTVLFVGTAVAGPEITYAPPAPEPVKSWTGFYFGVQGGGIFNGADSGVLVFDTDLDGAYDDSIAAFGDNFDGSFDSGFSGGVHLGYDIQMDNIVLGAILDINAADVSETQSGFSSTPAFYTELREFDYLATGRIRIGYLCGNDLLFYVSGGAAYADVEYAFLTDTPATVRPRGGSSGSDDFGYVVSAGVEFRVTENISLGVEYLYTDLGSGDFVTNLSGPAAFSGVAGSTDSRGSDSDFDFHTIQAKLSYRF